MQEQENQDETTAENNPIQTDSNDINLNSDESENIEQTENSDQSESAEKPKISSNIKTESKPIHMVGGKVSDEYKALFYGLREKLGLSPQDYIKRLIDNTANPPKAEVKEVEKIVNVEVDKKLTANQIIIELTDDELAIMKLIQDNRHQLLLRKDRSATTETFAQILKGSFFKLSRLKNRDNEFFTGYKN